MVFIYGPIDLGGPSFRLLRILKGCDPSIPCVLFQAWVRQREVAISYEAISYVWGSPERQCQVLLNGTSFGVTKSLHEALRCLQLKDEDRVIWVDAICIDQSNEIERGHQVRHMSDVYKEAARVIYWLGPPSLLTDICLDGLELLQEETRQVATRSWTKEQWMTAWKSLKANDPRPPEFERQGLQELLDRSWFRRVWILQEVANSQAAIVSSGKRSVSARVFGLAPFLMDVMPRSHCQGILDMMPSSFRQSSWFSESRDLYTLLENFGGSESSEERDLVYALLGVSSDAVGAIQPNYQMDEQEVIRAVFHFLFRTHPDSTLGPFPPSIRMLCRRLTFFNELVLEMAATNEDDGDTIVAFNLHRRPYLTISAQTLHAAARNRRRGTHILQEILESLRTSSRELSSNHVSAAIEGAAENDVCGDQVLRLVLSKTDHRPPVTDETLVKSAFNQLKGSEIMRLLLRHFTIADIPKAAILAAMQNEKCGQEIMSAFFMVCDENSFRRVDNVLRTIALERNIGRQALKVLIEHHRYTEQRLCSADIESVLEWIFQVAPDVTLMEQAIEDEALEILTVLALIIPWVPRVEYQKLLTKACSRNSSFVKSLLDLETDFDIAQECHEEDSPPLFIAIESNQDANAKLLLERGAPVNSRNSRGFAPLHIAIERISPSLVNAFLEGGANPNLMRPDGSTPLQSAAKGGHAQIVKSLCENGAWINDNLKYDMLGVAAGRGFYKLAEVLISLGSPLNAAYVYEHNSPLHHAAEAGHGDLVRLLMQQGADLEFRNADNHTALSLAARMKHIATIKQLHNQGADIDAISKCDYTPLIWAAERGHTQVIRTLLEAGANIEARTAFGQTALHLAAEFGQTAAAKVLLEHGANTKARDFEYFRTPLDWAATNGHVGVVKCCPPQASHPESSVV